jgi:hypothetical protein
MVEGDRSRHALHKSMIGSHVLWVSGKIQPGRFPARSELDDQCFRAVYVLHVLRLLSVLKIFDRKRPWSGESAKSQERSQIRYSERLRGGWSWLSSGSVFGKPAVVASS